MTKFIYRIKLQFFQASLSEIYPTLLQSDFQPKPYFIGQINSKEIQLSEFVHVLPPFLKCALEVQAKLNSFTLGDLSVSWVKLYL